MSLGTLLAHGRFPPPAGSWTGHGLFLHTESCNGLRLHNEAFHLHLGAGDVILDHPGYFSTLFLNDLFVWGGRVTAPQQTTPPNKSWSIKILEFLGRMSHPGPLILLEPWRLATTRTVSRHKVTFLGRSLATLIQQQSAPPRFPPLFVNISSIDMLQNFLSREAELLRTSSGRL